MSGKRRLPQPEESRVNKWFGYETILRENDPILANGYWVELYVGDIFCDDEAGTAQENIGSRWSLKKLFLEGMDILADRLEVTDVVGVYGDTSVSEYILHRLGFIVEENATTRVAYMALDKFLQRPWRRLTSLPN